MIGKHSVSGFVITFNEEANIRDCLEGMKWADEIVVVDSFSEDATVEIAREYTDRIVQRPFAGHVGQTRFALEQTTCDWVLWLDADERLTPAAHEQVFEALESPGDVPWAGFAFPRKTWFLDRWITHSGWYPQHKLRLFRREKAVIVGDEPHPAAIVDGPVRDFTGDILHYSYPGGLQDLVRRSASYADIGAGVRYERGMRFSILRLLLRPPFDLFKKYVLQLGLLDGLPGVAIAAGSAYYRFLREVSLWEIEHGREPEADA